MYEEILQRVLLAILVEVVLVVVLEMVYNPYGEAVEEIQGC